MKKICEKYGANSESVKKFFREAYPDKPIANSLYVGTRAIKTANIKSEQNPYALADKNF